MNFLVDDDTLFGQKKNEYLCYSVVPDWCGFSLLGNNTNTGTWPRQIQS